MKLKKNGGNIVHKQLSFMFTMLELGGSYIQKYNTISSEFVPDRSITPYVLAPNLQITDPEKKIANGDYTTYLKNVIWSLTSYQSNKETKLTLGTDYTIDDSTHAITILYNVGVSESVAVSFRADYLDKTRNQVTQFTWSKMLNTESETDVKFDLRLDKHGKLNLSPFKNWGEFTLNAQAINGDDELDDALVDYVWEQFDYDLRKFVTITDDDLWYISGNSTKQITVSQEYIQKVLLRVTATFKQGDKPSKSKTVLLRRFYGMWDSDSFFETGKYIFDDTTQVAIGAKVTNRQGDIKDPEKYFEMEIFYRKSPTDEWKSVCYGEEAIINLESGTTNHQTAIMCRELSAYMPLVLDDGSILTDDDGLPLVAQFPISEREVE